MLAFTRLHTLFFFVFGILLVGSSAHKVSPRHNALEARELQTNAARMEAGLPPLRPRQLFSPTRVARSPKPSGMPKYVQSSPNLWAYSILIAFSEPYSEVCDKRIKVSTGTGSSSRLVGFIAKTQTNGAFKVDRSGRSSSHLQVKFTPTSSPFNILIESSGSGSRPNLGFGGKNSNLNVAGAYNILTGTNSLASGSVPVNNANSLSSSYGRSYAESAVWWYSGSSLTASWVNPGKLTVSTEFYITQDDELIQIATGISAPSRSTRVYLSAEN
ncbi:hypothetical protein CVT25_010435 [Psilocybe cyanescens]|uniref:Uncharacterized protein n=1 Tax=Psilocybe cyanescens TaxID=93625 RepID=A0A409XP47_PSICY|nr:hypothetical protein CVT25_010435 [Psilocybe cyanescens]